MTKLYQVILSDSNVYVRDEHLDDYLYHKGFSVKDCYYIGELYEPIQSIEFTNGSMITPIKSEGEIVRGLCREIIKVEDYCDMKDFSSMTFTITNIEQERLIGGNTTIYFKPNDGEVYDNEFMIKTTKSIHQIDKDKLRESMLEGYRQYKEAKSEMFDYIKVGDII